MMEDFQDVPKTDLKYITWLTHDTILSNLLKYLGYWNKESIFRKPV